MQSEFVSLHCPLTPETYHILNAETLAQLPYGAYIINTARGGCVDLTALLEALDTGRVNSAALDVIENEPPADERVRQHPRLLLTPHVALTAAIPFWAATLNVALTRGSDCLLAVLAVYKSNVAMGTPPGMDGALLLHRRPA